MREIQEARKERSWLEGVRYELGDQAYFEGVGRVVVEALWTSVSETGIVRNYGRQYLDLIGELYLAINDPNVTTLYGGFLWGMGERLEKLGNKPDYVDFDPKTGLGVDAIFLGMAMSETYLDEKGKVRFSASLIPNLEDIVAKEKYGKAREVAAGILAAVEKELAGTEV